MWNNDSFEQLLLLLWEAGETMTNWWKQKFQHINALNQTGMVRAMDSR